MSVSLHQGDCLVTLRGMADNSVDSIVTDPPYGLSFMGKKWDYDVPSVEIWAECLRVLKPGGHLLAFAGTRTQHRMAVRIEDAGFEIRDMIAWVYGSGFPKSLDVSKALDKAAGAEREVVGVREDFARRAGLAERPNTANAGGYANPQNAGQITAPATEAARQWKGWGTALKPALEPITMARKPLAGTVTTNVLEHGTGALNIDGCRVPHADQGDEAGYREKCASVVGLGSNRIGSAYGEWTGERQDSASALGRFPANLIHDGSPEVLAHFPDSNGAGPSLPRVKVTGYGGGIGSGESAYTGGERIPFSAGSGSAARFFYCAKANKKDRNEGCERVQTWGNADLSRLEESLSELKKAMSGGTTQAISDSEWSTLLSGSSTTEPSRKAIKSIIEMALRTTTASKTLNCSRLWSTSAFIRAAIATATDNGLSLAELAESTNELTRNTTGAGMGSPLNAANALFLVLLETSRSANIGNVHETVKPTDLMRYLCRLVTPPGGVVLDPFTGSGSTGKAAMLEGFRFVGCEMSDEYADIAEARIRHAAELAQAASSKPSDITPTTGDLFEAA